MLDDNQWQIRRNIDLEKL